MGAVAIDLDGARLALAEVSQQAGALLRALPHAEAPVPGSAWTVRDTAVHLALDVQTNVDALTGPAQHFDLPAASSATERLATLNARAVQDVRTTDPRALAELVENAAAAFLRAADGRSGRETVATPWYGEGTSQEIGAMACAMLGELVVHGYDMARATGRAWPIAARSAALVLSGVADMLPLYFEPARGDRARTAYDIQVRRGPRFIVIAEGGTARVERPAAGAGADCHISADPVALLLVAYGRCSQWGPILTGKMVAWGRRPWLALSFRSLFTNP